MKKTLLLLILFMISFATYAQNIGIGTTAPATSLHISKGASGVTPFPATLLTVESNVNTYINLLSPALNETAILFGVPGSAANGVIMYNNPATPNGFQFRNNGNLTRFTIANNGNTGIGTTAPAAKLHVSAGDASFALFGPNSFGGQLYVGAAPNQGIAGTAQVLSSDGNLHIDPAPGKKTYLGYYQAGELYINPFGGNTGIGTTTPSATLDVNGFTKLGNASPSIKLKKLAGTTSAFNDGYVYITHGLDYSKILSVSITVYAGLVYYGPGQDNFATFDWSYNENSITVHNVLGKSASILSKPIKILIMYEE
ncbi:MAG: hypothetical protein V4717_07460 [Bacteroidota bacterium]